jgi:primosomal protein N' (replication factor Y)
MKAATSSGARAIASIDPVARVMVDLPLPHLDRPFDYLVSAELADAVLPGVRVRVRFAGRLIDAYVLERLSDSEHHSKLAMIERVVGGAAVLTAETTALFRAVADRYGGSFVDVARLGIPARHARAEAAQLASAPDAPDAVSPVVAPDPTGWARYSTGAAFIAALAAAKPARAIWSALPGDDWPLRIAEAMQATLAAGRGAVAVVPDARDLARLDSALSCVLGAGRHVALSADLGPSQRYRRWLAVRRGEVRAVAGTRAAAYAPVTDVGLLVVWDDGDDLHREPRAPYPDTRDILAVRSALTGAALLVGAYARTTQAQQLLESGWAHEIVVERSVLRVSAPRVIATGDDNEVLRDQAARVARLPSLAWRTARDALADGAPVLVQVARAGYVPSLACAVDRTAARCQVCSGPLSAASSRAIPTCRWCGRPAGQWSCPECGGQRMRAMAVGAIRTAEELGRAFPGTLVRASGGDSTLSQVDARPALIVATPGAEPLAVGGYGAALLLDGWSLLARQDLRASEEALRRWMNAAALVRPGAPVIVAADAGVAAVQALIRWDPAGFAARELAERAELRLPPAVRMASLSGTSAAVGELLDLASLPAAHELIGPVSVDGDVQRMLIRVPRDAGAALATALHQAAGLRSARKALDSVRIVLDPGEML